MMAGLKNGDSGTYRRTSEYDQVERIYAYRRVVGHPLVVVAGLPVEVVFESRRLCPSGLLI
jgi:hypothetical protein